MNWLRDEQRPEGPVGTLRSVRMTRPLKEQIQRIDSTLWKPYREDGPSQAECVDVLNY